MNSSATDANVVACLRSAERRSRSSSALGSIPFLINCRHSLALSRAFWRLISGYSNGSPGGVFAARVSSDQNKGPEARFAHPHTKARNIRIHHVVPNALAPKRLELSVGQAAFHH